MTFPVQEPGKDRNLKGEEAQEKTGRQIQTTKTNARKMTVVPYLYQSIVTTIDHLTEQMINPPSLQKGQPVRPPGTTVTSLPVPMCVLPQRDKVAIIMAMSSGHTTQFSLLSSILIWTANLGGMFNELSQYNSEVECHSTYTSSLANSLLRNIPDEGTSVDTPQAMAPVGVAAPFAKDITPPAQDAMTRRQLEDGTRSHRSNYDRLSLPDYTRCVKRSIYKSRPTIWRSVSGFRLFSEVREPDVFNRSLGHDLDPQTNATACNFEILGTPDSTGLIPSTRFSRAGLSVESNVNQVHVAKDIANGGNSEERGVFLKQSNNSELPGKPPSGNHSQTPGLGNRDPTQPSGGNPQRSRGSPDGQSSNNLHGSTAKIKTTQSVRGNNNVTFDSVPKTYCRLRHSKYPSRLRRNKSAASLFAIPIGFEEGSKVETDSLFSRKAKPAPFQKHYVDRHVDLPPDTSHFRRELYEVQFGGAIGTKIQKMSEDNLPKAPVFSDIREVVIQFINKDDIEYELDNFGLRQTVGEGAFGVVHLADLYLGNGALREVVVKQSDSEFYDNKSILREARILAYLGDTMFVPRFYGVVCDGTAWADPSRDMGIVQEYFGKGCTLANVMTLQFEILSSKKFWMNVSTDMIRGMDCIHKKRVILNDVKPNNILVDCNMYKNLASRIRYIDMGIATYESGYNYQLHRDYLARFQHLAPEVINGSDTSTASDVYSLGFMLLQLAESGRLQCIEEIAHDCMHHSPKKRPSCQEILVEIEKLAETVEPDDMLISSGSDRRNWEVS